ncbi:MAG: hypothetical protein NXI30_02105 [bacterium]|nr:hypothetical protein [bacterium]
MERKEPVAAGGVHHVVWCVAPERFESVRRFWEESLDVSLHEIDLPDLGLRVLISWRAGIEIMTPAYASGLMVDAARAFLAEHGDGVYSVVYDVNDLDARVAALEAEGRRLLFRETISADEVDARQLSDGERFSIRQAGFDEYCGLRLCLQEIVPEP